MGDDLDRTLLRRRLAQRPRTSAVKGVYSQQAWVNDLDIVNELGGHDGCVNALSWSKSGRFLASGSDDQCLNIWAFNPEYMAKPFTLNTCVSTGHSANIFSVKFMPHSNDRTVVTCAGDSEVRVFDIERGGASGHASEEARMASTRSQRFQRFFSSARFLNDGNTNARVYRSHADRVKRIVTESSPHLFLTCSEDGEVRQWDLRQPSSAYPAPRGGHGFMSYRHADEDHTGIAPPPLISYKNYSLDLNTISCSPSQPHYIALGGAHLHCFLHDRRMLGRNLDTERGQPSSQMPEAGSHEDELMGQATRCVKRFAPNGKPRMATDDNGHITACKISDANPNEMIVSWSGDHIYSFDLVQSPDAREAEATRSREYKESRANRVNQKDRKRKRQALSSTSLAEPARARMATTGEDEDDDREISLRVRYGNGQSENIPLNPPSGESTNSVIEQTRQDLLSESQQLSDRVAKALVKLRKTLFDFETVVEESTSNESSTDLTPHTRAFTAVLGQATTLLPQMREIMSAWRFPMDPTRGEVGFQQTLRGDRQSSHRLVQAAGTLARVLGGKLQTMDPSNDKRLIHFRRIEPAPLERDQIDRPAQFAYDFLKAILLWLDGGRGQVVEGFRRGAVQARFSKRHPLESSDGDEALEEKLIPYLADLASDNPVVNIDVSRFEHDENRVLFSTQKHAVQSFARAVGGFDLGWAEESNAPTGSRQSLDRPAACRFWGIKVGRSLLMSAGEGVNYEFVNHAFGGLNVPDEPDLDPMDVERDQEDIDLDESDPEVAAVELATRNPTVVEAEDEDAVPELIVHRTDGTWGSPQQHDTPQSDSQLTAMDTMNTSVHSEAGLTASSSVLSDIATHLESAGDEESDAEDNESDDDDDDDDEGEGEGEDDGGTFEADSDGDEEMTHRIVYRSSSGFGGSRQRARVEMDKPCGTHTRTYKGHCNVKTVKDVNFYGLNDEYVISGSDDGNLFLWDKKTSKLLNILEGDSEVVNVIQGHPYEPMIAASGIDSTVKIFSPDARLQEDAREGRDIANPGGGITSSLRSGRRRPSTETPSNTGLTSRRKVDEMYQILSRNDAQRRGGVGDAYLTRSMLARLAASINRGPDIGGQEGQIVIDDNCRVM